jgi:hypothetical protein
VGLAEKKRQWRRGFETVLHKFGHAKAEWEPTAVPPVILIIRRRLTDIYSLYFDRFELDEPVSL